MSWIETESQKSSDQVDEKLQRVAQTFTAAREQAAQVIVGQHRIVDRMLMALVLNGHVLLEGFPGLAKTSMVKVVAGLTGLSFARVQFTPDLLPSDLIGTQIYNPAEHRFETKKGPIFTNLLLADEINRAPAKVQSALLECMAERQVSIGGNSFPLESPFLVLATQNPIEQEGTYTLPEAQLDRFLFYLKVQYGTIENEMQIVEKAMASKGKEVILKPVMDKQTIHELKQLVYEVQIAQAVRQYIVELVFMSRQAATRSKNKHLAKWIAVGASPRASIALEQAARLSAIMAGRWYVTPQDVKDVAADILRHRIIKSFEAEVEGVTADDVVANLLQEVAIP